MGLLRAGFYKAAEEIRADIAEVPDPNEALVAAYLRSGSLIIMAMHADRDLLDPDRRLTESAAIMTDGVWVWRRNLAHYVEEYHVALPPEFSSHIQGQDWQMPELTGEKIHEVAAAFRQEQNEYFAKLGR